MTPTRHRLLAAIATAVSLLAVETQAEDWPQWRGPRANGVSNETSLPSRWGSEQGIQWRTPLAGLGTSTPIVSRGRIFLTYQLGSGPIDRRGAEFPEAVAARRPGEARAGVTFVVEAFDQSNGTSLFRRELPLSEDPSALPPVHPKHNLASPSVVTDGEHAFAWSGAGQLVALDATTGEVLWARHLGEDYAPFDVLWGHGSSPLLYRDRLFVLCDHPPGAYLLAFDKMTGKEVLRVDRGTGIRSYTTPFVVRHQGEDQLIVNGSDHLTAYDPMSGRELWRFGEAVTLAIPMPVTAGGVLYASRGYSSGPYSAIRLGGRGDVTDSHAIWHVPTSAPYISSLVLYDGLLYMATERGIASVVDPETGELLWRERLGGAFTASPVAGDGKIYFLNEAGQTTVLRSGPEPSVLARNDLGERTLASPSISNGILYLRSDLHLVAIHGDGKGGGATPP